MQEQDHDPRVLHCPWCPEHSQSKRCSLRCLFCQVTAVMHELEDVAGPCVGCGAGRAGWQLFDNAPWAEEGKDSYKFRKAWINSSPFPTAREPSSRAFPHPLSLEAHTETEASSRNTPAAQQSDRRSIIAHQVQSTPIPRDSSPSPSLAPYGPLPFLGTH